jgi:hypothetical protein
MIVKISAVSQKNSDQRSRVQARKIEQIAAIKRETPSAAAGMVLSKALHLNYGHIRLSG